MLLAVIAVIATVSGLAILNDNKDKLYDQQVEMIKKAAKNYQLATGKEDIVTLETLANEGYLDSSDLINPRNNETLTGCVKIDYDDVRNQYKFEFIENESECSYK